MEQGFIMHFEKLLFLFILFSLNCFSQNAISPRIGNEIDKYEREYFGLFPAIKGFQFASTTLAQDSSLQVIITRKIDDNLSDTSYQLSKEIISNLAKYIDEFESLRKRRNYNIDWKSFSYQAEINLPFRNRINEPTDFTIIDTSESYTNGILVYADDSLVVFGKNATTFQYDQLKNVRIYKVSEMKAISKIRTGNTMKGVLIGGLITGGIFAASSYSNDWLPLILMITIPPGAIVGGIVGAVMDIDSENEINGNQYKYLDILPRLKSNSVYTAYPPPEVIKLIK